MIVVGSEISLGWTEVRIVISDIGLAFLSVGGGRFLGAKCTIGIEHLWELGSIRDEPVGYLLHLLQSSLVFLCHLLYYNHSNNFPSLKRVHQLCQQITMACFRGTPTSQHFSFQFRQFSHRLFVLQDVLFVFLNATLPSILLNSEGISPEATGCSRDIVIVPTNIDMVLVVEPLHQVVVALLPEMFNFDVDHSCFRLFLLPFRCWLHLLLLHCFIHWFLYVLLLLFRLLHQYNSYNSLII